MCPDGAWPKAPTADASASPAALGSLQEPLALRALLWDVDGTLAETERDGHRVAFNRAFEELGLPWRWSETAYGPLLRVTGGRERILAYMALRDDAPQAPAQRQALAQELHRLKNAHYAALATSGAVALRPGVRNLIDAAQRAGLRQAIATTTSRTNVGALLSYHFGPDWAQHFDAVVCGEDVAAKKPAPEVYLQALDRLRLAPAVTLAIEDSPAGVAAARAAGVPVLVTRSVYFAADGYKAAVAVGPGLHTRRAWRPAPLAGDAPLQLQDLRAWHAAALAA